MAYSLHIEIEDDEMRYDWSSKRVLDNNWNISSYFAYLRTANDKSKSAKFVVFFAFSQKRT